MQARSEDAARECEVLRARVAELLELVGGHEASLRVREERQAQMVTELEELGRCKESLAAAHGERALLAEQARAALQQRDRDREQLLRRLDALMPRL